MTETSRRPKTGGRVKGTPNKSTKSVKTALEEAFTKRGGVAALLRWAEENPTDFYKLWAKMMPTQTEISGPGGGPVEMGGAVLDALARKHSS